MKSSHRPSTTLPSITARLQSICTYYADYRSGESLSIAVIPKKILTFLKNIPDHETTAMKELMSACIFHALYDALSVLESKTFLQTIINEINLFASLSVLNISFSKIPSHNKTKSTVYQLTSFLQESKDIVFNIAHLRTKIVLIDSRAALKNANTIKNLQCILSEITLSKTDRDIAPIEFNRLINLMMISAIKIGSLDNLKIYLSYISPFSLPSHDAMIHATKNLQTHIVKWLLSDTSAYQPPSATLSQAMNILIEREAIYRKKNKPIPEALFEIANMIFHDESFTPNYFAYPLMRIAINANSLYFVKLLLQHPYINLQNIKYVILKKVNLEYASREIDCIFKHPPFYNLEKDWLAWSNKHIPSSQKNAFQKIVIDNHLFHQSGKWKLFSLATVIQSLPNDIKNEIMKTFHLVCCPSLHGFFAKKESPKTIGDNQLMVVETNHLASMDLK